MLEENDRRTTQSPASTPGAFARTQPERAVLCGRWYTRYDSTASDLRISLWDVVWWTGGKRGGALHMSSAVVGTVLCGAVGAQLTAPLQGPEDRKTGRGAYVSGGEGTGGGTDRRTQFLQTGDGISADSIALMGAVARAFVSPGSTTLDFAPRSQRWHILCGLGSGSAIGR